LKSLQPSSFLLAATIYPISSAQYSTIISLLYKHYSVYGIQSRTGIGKSTIGRIKKEVDTDKKNNKGSYPSKLLPYNKQSILHQITTGKLDNAVQAANFISSILPTLSQPKQLGMSSRRIGFPLLSRRSTPFSSGIIEKIISDLPNTIKPRQ
jgi:hypothetical protein